MNGVFVNKNGQGVLEEDNDIYNNSESDVYLGKMVVVLLFPITGLIKIVTMLSIF